MELFITDLSAYNEGFLSGRWIQLPLTQEELIQVSTEILKEGELVSGTTNHEELFITDYEAEILIGEYDNIERLNELAQTMEAFTDEEFLKLRFLAYEGYNERDVIDNGLETYEVDIYDYRDNSSFTDTFELLASDFIDEGLFGEIPKSIESYIDYEAIARDLRMDYSEFEPNVIARVV